MMGRRVWTQISIVSEDSRTIARKFSEKAIEIQEYYARHVQE